MCFSHILLFLLCFLTAAFLCSCSHHDSLPGLIKHTVCVCIFSSLYFAHLSKNASLWVFATAKMLNLQLEFCSFLRRSLHCASFVQFYFFHNFTLFSHKQKITLSRCCYRPRSPSCFVLSMCGTCRYPQLLEGKRQLWADPLLVLSCRKKRLIWQTSHFTVIFL